MLVKDGVQHSAGDRYQHGMRFLRDHEYRSPTDTELVRRYREAGFVILGRTKVPELTSATTTEPLAHGPAHNPWDLDHTTGGSSGGSAAAVAARMVPVAHGNDMGGSIRIPASCCGLVGLKPSRHRTSLYPHGEYWGPLTHEHVLTRSVRDSAGVLDATAGGVAGELHEAPPPSRPWLDELGADPGGLRVGLVTERPHGGDIDAECVQAVRDVAEHLAAHGHVVEPASADAMHTGDMASFGAIVAAGLAAEVIRWETELGTPVTDLEPMSASMVERGPRHDRGRADGSGRPGRGVEPCGRLGVRRLRRAADADDGGSAATSRRHGPGHPRPGDARGIRRDDRLHDRVRRHRAACGVVADPHVVGRPADRDPARGALRP